VPGFSKNVAGHVRSVASVLLEKGAQALVFDLRGNVGGYFPAVRYYRLLSLQLLSVTIIAISLLSAGSRAPPPPASAERRRLEEECWWSCSVLLDQYLCY
jgi:hypothetical protein